MKLKEVAQTVNQTLLKITTGSPASNLDTSTPHMTILQTDNKSTAINQVTFINTQLCHEKTPTDQTHLNTPSQTLSQILKKKNNKTNHYGHRCFIIFTHPT